MSDDLVCLSDFLATAGDHFGEHPSEAVDSVSFIGTLKQEDPGKKATRESLVHHSAQGVYSFRQGKWKLILGSGSGGFSDPVGEALKDAEDGIGQLYDLEKDPEEQSNVWSDHPEVVAELDEALKRVVARDS